MHEYIAGNKTREEHGAGKQLWLTQEIEDGAALEHDVACSSRRGWMLDECWMGHWDSSSSRLMWPAGDGLKQVLRR